MSDVRAYRPFTHVHTRTLTPQTGRDIACVLATGSEGAHLACTHTLSLRPTVCAFVQKKRSAVIAKTFVANPHIATLTRLSSEQGRRPSHAQLHSLQHRHVLLSHSDRTSKAASHRTHMRHLRSKILGTFEPSAPPATAASARDRAAERRAE